MQSGKYESAPKFKTYLSEEYKIDIDTIDEKIVVGKTRIPFLWDDYDEKKTKRDLNNVFNALGDKKDSLREKLEFLFRNELGDLFTVQKKTIIGDQCFNPKRFVTYDHEMILKIYNDVLNLNLNNEEQILEFVREYGLPYSDGWSHMKNYVTQDIDSSSIEAAQNKLLNEDGSFCDMEELYKVAYSLWLIKKLSKVSNLLSQFENPYESKVRTKVKTQKLIQELYFILIQILITYDGKIFYTSIEHEEVKYVSNTGALSYYVVNEIDFTNNELNENEIRQRLFLQLNGNQPDDGMLRGELNNNDCKKILGLLFIALRISKYEKVETNSLISLVFSSNSEVAYRDIAIEAMNVGFSNFEEEIIVLANKIFYDIKSEAMSNTSIIQSVTDTGEVCVENSVPSMLHALFYALFYDEYGPIQECPNCKRLYRSKKSYCSDKCSTNFRKRKSRNKNSSDEKEEMDK